MTDKKINKVFIFVFLTILSLPLVLLILGIKTDDPFSSKKISANFSRNFPLKNDYFKIYSFLKEDIFNSLATPDKVIKWKNWYFLGDNYSNNLSESKGKLLFTKEELNKIAKNLIYKNNWATRNNIRYYMAMAPNKESIYGNLLPYKEFSSNRKLKQIDSICKQNNIRFINLGNQFPKNDNKPLYHRTDTHWNDYGAFFGYNEIIKELNKDNFKIEPNQINDYAIEEKYLKDIGDLKNMIGETKGEENAIVLKLKKKSLAKSLEPLNPILENINVSPKEYEIRFESEVDNKYKILFFRDSFSAALLNFIKESFSESIFIFDRRFNETLINKERPDIIIDEVVERDIDLFLEDKNFK